jgi:hypothetical protein
MLTVRWNGLEKAFRNKALCQAADEEGMQAIDAGEACIEEGLGCADVLPVARDSAFTSTEH